MKTIPSALLILILAFPMSGCSVIGALVGSGNDTRASEKLTRINWLDDLTQGTPLILVTVHNDTLKGELAAIQEDRGYEKLYIERVSGTLLGDVLPAPGKHATIVAHEKKDERFGYLQYRFDAKVLGFDPGIVRLLPVKARYRPDFPLSSLDSIVSDDGHSIATATLVRMIESNRVPFLSQLGVLHSRDTLWIPTHEISGILREPSQAGFLTGLIVGAAVDVAVVMLLKSSMHFGMGPKW